MEDKDGTLCPAGRQPKAFPETEAGVTGDFVQTSAGAKATGLLHFLLCSGLGVQLSLLSALLWGMGVDRSCYTPG